MSSLTKIVVQSTVDSVTSQLIEAIISNQFRPGDRIPTEAELMEQFGVGRNSIREAVKILCAYGILEIRRADGTFVRSKFSPQMLNPLIYGIILERDPQDLLELREAIDAYAYRLAIKNATADDLSMLSSVLDELVAALRADEPDAETIVSWDSKFHDGVSLCGHNPIFYQINHIVTLMLTQYRLRTVKSMIQNGQIQFLIDTHQRSLDTIRNRSYEDIDSLVGEGLLHMDIVTRSGTDTAAQQNA